MYVCVAGDLACLMTEKTEIQLTQNLSETKSSCVNGSFSFPHTEIAGTSTLQWPIKSFLSVRNKRKYQCQQDKASPHLLLIFPLRTRKKGTQQTGTVVN